MVISHERGMDGILLMKNGTYMWSPMKKIFGKSNDDFGIMTMLHLYFKLDTHWTVASLLTATLHQGKLCIKH